MSGALTTSSTSKIIPGTDGTAGTLTFNNNLTMTAGSTFSYDLSASHSSGNDKVVVTGTLALNSTVFNIKGPATLDTSDYTLATGASITGTPTVTWVGTAPSNISDFTVVNNGTTVMLHFAGAPTLTASASPSSVVRNQLVTITASVTPGTIGNVASVTVDATPIGGINGASLVLSNTVAGVQVWTNTFVVSAGTGVGSKSLSVTAANDSAPTPYTGSGSATLTITVVNDVWNGGAGDAFFSSGANWISGLAPGYTGDSLEFAGTVNLSPTLETSYSVTGVTFDSGAGSFNISPANGSTLTLPANGVIANNSASVQTLSVPIAGGGLTKTGNGTLALSGANTYTGATLVNAGTLAVSGSVAGGDMTVASQAGNAALTVSGSLGSGANTMAVGAVANAVGALWQTGGTISLGTGSAFFGHMPGGYGYGRIDSGTLNMTELQLGSWGSSGGNGGDALLEVNGGTVTDSGWLVMARGGAAQTGVLNVFSGSLGFAGGGLICNWGSGQTSIINILGGSINSSSAGVGFVEWGNGNTGILNLNGGLLSVSAVGGWGWWFDGSNNGRLNFNGGTLQPSGDNGNFLTVTTANIYGGGATIDNNGHAITIAQPLLAPTGNGIASASVTSGGAGYIAPPIITITNATGDTTGIGATAIAQINPLTGVVTNVIVTCPGVNYTATPIFVVSGGGATTPAVITGATPTANTSGGLTKNGNGTLTLTGANTYTGNTTIGVGTLALSGSGAIANSAHITVAGGATFDVSAVTFALGGSQTLANSGASTATINGNLNASAGTVALSYASGTPSFTVNNTLTLSGSTTLTVNNTGAQLAHGSYKLISKSGSGTVTGTLPAVTVTGGGAAEAVSLQVQGGELYLVVNAAAPVASSFTLGAVSGVPATVKIIGGKHTPTDADGDTLTVTTVSTPANGTATTDGTSITYTAGSTFTGTDSFTYTVGDGLGGTDTATITVTVAADGEGFNKISAKTDGGNDVLTYAGVPGSNYALDFTTSLNAPVTWTPVVTNTADATTGLLNFTNATPVGNHFYRTRYVAP